VVPTPLTVRARNRSLPLLRVPYPVCVHFDVEGGPGSGCAAEGRLIRLDRIRADVETRRIGVEFGHAVPVPWLEHRGFEGSGPGQADMGET